MLSALHPKTILITGAGGSIGSALVKSLAASSANQLLLLDNSEPNLYQVDLELRRAHGHATHIPVFGDVGDASLLSQLFERYRPDIVYHAAALKHVPLMERNPLAAIRTNSCGTFTLAQAAIRFKSSALVMISTDKAVNPHSIMGASKRVAELSLLSLGNSPTLLKSLRLANVWGSSGSVVPLFQQQILSGGPITVTEPGAARFFLSLDEAVELILAAAELDAFGVLIPQIREPVRIIDLAHQLIRAANLAPSEISVVFGGLRPGEKLSEELTAASESAMPTSDRRLRRITADLPRSEDFAARFEKLTDAVRRHDPAASVELVCQLVPEYRPSEWLRNSLSDSPALSK